MSNTRQDNDLDDLNSYFNNLQDVEDNKKLTAPIKTRKALIEVMKIYNNDSKKYSGEKYKVYSMKLRLFQDICNRIGLLQNQYKDTYSLILKSKVLEYYTTKIAGINLDFETMIKITYAYFEITQVREQYKNK
jgi:hypothetical protein